MGMTFNPEVLRAPSTPSGATANAASLTFANGLRQFGSDIGNGIDQINAAKFNEQVKDAAYKKGGNLTGDELRNLRTNFGRDITAKGTEQYNTLLKGAQTDLVNQQAQDKLRLDAANRMEDLRLQGVRDANTASHRTNMFNSAETQRKFRRDQALKAEAARQAGIEANADIAALGMNNVVKGKTTTGRSFDTPEANEIVKNATKALQTDLTANRLRTGVYRRNEDGTTRRKNESELRKEFMARPDIKALHPETSAIGSFFQSDAYKKANKKNTSPLESKFKEYSKAYKDSADKTEANEALRYEQLNKSLLEKHGTDFSTTEADTFSPKTTTERITDVQGAIKARLAEYDAAIAKDPKNSAFYKSKRAAVINAGNTQINQIKAVATSTAIANAKVKREFAKDATDWKNKAIIAGIKANKSGKSSGNAGIDALTKYAKSIGKDPEDIDEGQAQKWINAYNDDGTLMKLY